jgi:hypothetical protein
MAQQKQEYIYFIKDNKVNTFKIGVSCNPKERLSQLQTGNSSELSIYTEFEIQCAPKFEKWLHAVFADKRIVENKQLGEWFKITEKDIDKITKQFIKKAIVPSSESIYQAWNKNLIQTLHDSGRLLFWRKNRPIDQGHLNELVNYMNDYYGTKNYVMPICYVNKAYDDEKREVYTVIDGQHRISAILNTKKEVSIDVKIYEDLKENEIDDIFLNINKMRQVPAIYLDERDKKNIVNQVKGYLCGTFANMISYAPRFNTPQISVQAAHFDNSLITRIDEINDETKNTRKTPITAGEIIDRITKFNNSRSKIDYETFKDINTNTVTKEGTFLMYLTKCRENNCYLGLYPKNVWINYI